MPKGDDVQKELEKRQVKDWTARVTKRAGRLPLNIRGACKRALLPQSGGVFGLGAGLGDHMARQRKREDELVQVAESIAKMPGRGRRKFFEEMFPGLEKAAERAWNMLSRMPYQSGWQRKAFRAPKASRIVARRRGDWAQSILRMVSQYDADIEWFAAWAGHIAARGYVETGTLDVLLAAAIDDGGAQGETVFQILCDTVRGEHPTAIVSQPIISALLICSRPEAWELVEKLLLAAQRQEGLRQSILEAVDMAHPEAFKRMLRMVLENNLARFSATVRAADVWFSYSWDSASAGTVNGVIEKALELLDSNEARTAALKDGSPEDAYLALWAYAYEDAPATIPRAAALLDDPDAERRFAAVYLLTQIGITTAYPHLCSALEDDDLRIVAWVLNTLPFGSIEKSKRGEVFKTLDKVLDRAPGRKKKLEAIVWPWCESQFGKQFVTSCMFQCVGEEGAKKLTKYVPLMDANGRCRLAADLSKKRVIDAESRSILLELVGDASAYVRESAVEGLSKASPVSDKEAPELEALLKRKPGDLRRGVLNLLLRGRDKQTLASAGRLLEAKDANMRAGGLELLRRMAEDNRSPKACRSRARAYRDAQNGMSPDEKTYLDAILGGDADTADWTIENVLGLLDAEQLTPPVSPVKRDIPSFKTAGACLKALDDLIHEHREVPVTFEQWGQREEKLFGEITWELSDSNIETLEGVPLRELLETWLEKRGPALRDSDGCEILRALLLFPEQQVGQQRDPRWVAKLQQAVFGARKLAKPRYPALLRTVLMALLTMEPPEQGPNCLLDIFETILAQVPLRAIMLPVNPLEWYVRSWRDYSPHSNCLVLIRTHRKQFEPSWKPEQDARLWQLLHWMDLPNVTRSTLAGRVLRATGLASDEGGAALCGRKLPELEETVAAFKAGATTKADVLDQLRGDAADHEVNKGGWYRSPWVDLARLTKAKDDPLLKDCPELKELTEHLRDRVLDIELRRGDTATPATSAAKVLGSVRGAQTAMRLLQALGKANFARGYAYGSESKATVLSHLVRVSLPDKEDTPEHFAQLVADVDLKEKRLIEFAVYAPQWARHVEHAIGMPTFEDAVWWFHAHTKDSQWSVDQNIREQWEAEVTERTPLSAEDLVSGAVDVAWFQRVHDRLGEGGWSRIDKAARYTSSAGGHKRAQLFADAMTGRLDKGDLCKRIDAKRHQDSVRALGLFPLPKAKRAREKDVLERYEQLQEFLRTSKQFGAQRRESEKRAVTIGMENLARTAGYPDPIRLQWAMERQAVADLAKGPVAMTEGEVTVALRLDALGTPQIDVEKKGKALKAVPAKLKKVAAIKELTTRKTALKRQCSRMRQSLELAMCRGDAFSGKEVRDLCAHPMLAPMLRNLVFTGDGVMGYPIANGKALVDRGGKEYPVAVSAEFRIAYPHDLLESDEWDQWQHECFVKERVQPFKQVFRELYVLTESEKKAGTLSSRYAGHQVHPRQAMALLGGRGWVHHHEEGIRRTFHERGLSAWLAIQEPFFTPAEIEGITVEGVSFTKVGDWRPLPLIDIPPRVFSEVMRDMDLVVSVAHRGGVDPEASASTTEMRAALLKETLALLKIDNVRVEERRALIDGELGSYSLHLGSAVTHMMPGGALFIVPVHAQHRGRLFLPFADDDPRTAEVISKTLLLARDKKIKDPNILRQITASA